MRLFLVALHEQHDVSLVDQALQPRVDVPGVLLPASRALDGLHQGAVLLHLLHDVQAPDQLASNVQLRERFPIRVVLQSFPDFLVLQDIEGRILDVVFVEHVDGFPREAAEGLGLGSFHEQHHWGEVYQASQPRVQIRLASLAGAANPAAACGGTACACFEGSGSQRFHLLDELRRVRSREAVDLPGAGVHEGHKRHLIGAQRRGDVWAHVGVDLAEADGLLLASDGL
mmetsp:Transcript_27104/g.72211  ORF Transcript_27104/g.72211 Transcript_27104/m.72211 type:complete len:228 (+) Transcript_27104:364-1047(+)